MPTRERVQAFVAMVEANKFVEAIREFYTEDATMQENLGDVRAGRDALVAAEEAALRRVKSITTRPGSTFAIDGDRVIVHWVFDIEQADGKRFTLDELAYQTWRGDRIAQERFYYDPAQRKPGVSRARKRTKTPRRAFTEISRAIFLRDRFIAFFIARARTLLRSKQNSIISPHPSLGLVSGFECPAGAGRFAVSCSADRRRGCSSVAERRGLKPGGRRFDSCRFHQTRIAQWVEQMTM